VEIRVLAVSSMWTACYISAETGLGRERVQYSHVTLAAVEMDLGWPLPRYAIPVVVSAEQFGCGCLMKILTIAVKERQSRYIRTISIQRSYWCLIGFGQSKTGREGVERESKSRNHCVDVFGTVRRSWDSKDRWTRRGTIEVIYLSDLSSHGCIRC
jgi:hypothetical protein